ncbi:hypothetical protein FHT40_002507 [Mycolicibacterium sp. BK556]|uniref:hypothetical protein n=1 Tax=Mycobacteriaceae TaxID=1762 RepID=UPI001060F485|nr:MULTISPECIES: hypothetical protein [Mycobacteriaceae]MBB3602846.1 hypothetical protein [Mycolicibacterium sp. BK556]MBB3633041.1 hypothetical protein [Mycolicibacterium sp. BK607]MBB3750588.1 hypothetical protein [Mycolicibacterium sp. BK634]TDO07016.1 hypothetical protein EV580_5978 [Mycobacterium sp. BK086]
METVLGLAKAIPPDAWLVLSVFASAIVIGLHWVIAHVVGRDASHDHPDAGTHVESDRELLGS